MRFAIVCLLAACSDGGGVDPIVGTWDVTGGDFSTSTAITWTGTLQIDQDLTGQMTLSTGYTSTTGSPNTSTNAIEVTPEGGGDYSIGFPDGSVDPMACTLDGDSLTCDLARGTISGEATTLTASLFFERE